MTTLSQPIDFPDSTQLLADLGVSEAQLLAALARGEAAFASCTSNHPPMAAGFYRFAETVVRLAEQLAGDGWTREDTRNFSTVVRADGRVAIAVASADSGAGDLSAEVMTRSPKGPTTLQAITHNLLLPFDASAEESNAQAIGAPVTIVDGQQLRQTWLLLQNRRDGMLYAELSLPRAMDERGFVQSFAIRIPLTPMPLDPMVLAAPSEPPVNASVSVTPIGH